MFAFISPPAAEQSREVGSPFLLPSNADIETWKNNHETHSSWVALTSSPSEEERALCRGQSLSHERKRGIMPDGSLLFPEGGGEPPPYANARNWPRPPPISRHGASQLSFAARETDVAPTPCITSEELTNLADISFIAHCVRCHV